MSLLISAAEMLENEAKIVKAANTFEGRWINNPEAEVLHQKWVKTAKGLRELQAQLNQVNKTVEANYDFA